jgi:hypothetical protein
MTADLAAPHRTNGLSGRFPGSPTSVMVKVYSEESDTNV